MAIDLYWGRSSAYCWRVLLALEHKGLAYRSHMLQFDRQEHQAPQMLAINQRLHQPVMRDGDYVVFESVAILYYLDLKYPQPPIFGRNPGRKRRDHACDLRVPGLRRAKPDADRQQHAVPARADARRGQGGGHVGGHASGGQREARTIERRLAQSGLGSRREFLRRRHGHLSRHPPAAAGPGAAVAAHELAARFLPLEINYPAAWPLG